MGAGVQECGEGAEEGADLQRAHLVAEDDVLEGEVPLAERRRVVAALGHVGPARQHGSLGVWPSPIPWSAFAREARLARPSLLRARWSRPCQGWRWRVAAVAEFGGSPVPARRLCVRSYSDSTRSAAPAARVNELTMSLSAWMDELIMFQ